jgi:hypothetical protein
MSWSFGFDDDDAFFRPSFDTPTDFDTSSSLFFQPDEGSSNNAAPSASPSTSHTLADENAELRQTAITLRERFADITSVNARLKSQLEECRSRFRSAMFSGFNTRK